MQKKRSLAIIDDDDFDEEIVPIASLLKKKERPGTTNLPNGKKIKEHYPSDLLTPPLSMPSKPPSLPFDDDDDDDDIPLTELVRKKDQKKAKKSSVSKVKKKLEKSKKKLAKKNEKKAMKKEKRKKPEEKTNHKEDQKVSIVKIDEKIEKKTDEKIKEIIESSTIEEETEEFKWWKEEEGLDDGTVKWTTLEHNGVYFPPEYEPHKIRMLYRGQPVDLTPEAEEVATFFAGVLGTAYADNLTFRSNFFHDFRKILLDTPAFQLITKLEECDFSQIAEHLTLLKESRKDRTKAEKLAEKTEKDQIIARYGYCVVDGRREKIGNFRVEPPGLFRGRGEHPKMGKLKQRVNPEQVILNIGANAPVPSPPLGHTWGKIVHDNTVTWLANWVENVNGETKYIFLAPGSKFKGVSDMRKFEKARELKLRVDDIRKMNEAELLDTAIDIRQRATALWLIDHLALRAGNEKGDEEADTVGCCSLRVEHLMMRTPRTVVFDFLGKDSIRYYNEVTVPTVVFANLKEFMARPKKPMDAVFDTLSTTTLNGYLNKLMPGLSAKVFRTFNASFTFQRELAHTPRGSEADTAEKILAYNRANRHVAVLCNHQRAIPKSHGLSMERLGERLLMLKVERLQIKRELKHRNLLLKGEIEDESDVDEAIETRKKAEAAVELAERQAKLTEAGKSPVRPPPTPKDMPDERLKKRLSMLTEQIRKLKLQRIDRDEGKQTALGTSKINYIDPRISAAWCYSHGVPVEKIFNRSLREKFKWALEVDANWKF